MELNDFYLLGFAFFTILCGACCADLPKWSTQFTTYPPQKLVDPFGESAVDKSPEIDPKEIHIMKQTINAIIDEYIVQHSRASIDESNVCSRKYIVAVFTGCPHSLGNHVDEILNKILIGIVTNRTVIWKCDNIQECDKFIHRAEWFPSMNDIFPMLRKQYCTATFGQKDVDVKGGIPLQPIYQNGAVSASYKFQCYRWESDAMVQSCKALVRREGMMFLHDNVHLSPHIKTKLRTLFALGSDYVYGIMMRKVFSFTDIVQKYTAPVKNEIDAILRAASQQGTKPLIIAVHVRHFLHEDQGHDDNNRHVDCVKKYVDRALRVQQKYTNASKVPCIALIASDREFFLLKMNTTLSPMCTIMTSPRPHHADIAGNEYGPFGNGLVSVADFELLSHGDVFFDGAIGDYWTKRKPTKRLPAGITSTFGMSIGALVASRENQHRPWNYDAERLSPHFTPPFQRLSYLEPCLENREFAGYEIRFNHDELKVMPDQMPFNEALLEPC